MKEKTGTGKEKGKNGGAKAPFATMGPKVGVCQTAGSSRRKAAADLL